MWGRKKRQGRFLKKGSQLDVGKGSSSLGLPGEESVMALATLVSPWSGFDYMSRRH